MTNDGKKPSHIKRERVFYSFHPILRVLKRRRLHSTITSTEGTELIIDTESHIFWWARNHYTTGLSMIRHYTWHEHSSELFLAEMENAGVDMAFVISYDAEDVKWSSEQRGYALEDFAGGKKYTKKGCERDPKRLLWFSTIKNPDHYPSSKIVEADLKEGAKGIKVFPGFIQKALNHPELIESFRICSQHNAPVLISLEVLRPPLTLGLNEYVQQLGQVLDMFPKSNFCLLHAGCADPLTPKFEPISRLMDHHDNLYLSTAFPGEVWDDGSEYPFPNYLRRIEEIVKRVGTSRTMWGTDWPWFEWAFKYQQGVNAILRHAHFLSEDQKREFMGESAIRFLNTKS